MSRIHKLPIGVAPTAGLRSWARRNQTVWVEPHYPTDEPWFALSKDGAPTPTHATSQALTKDEATYLKLKHGRLSHQPD